MSTLSGREMTKPGREYRITLFAKKFKEGDEFELNNGKKVKLVYDKEIERKILRKQTLDQLEFYTTTGQKLKLKDFKKNKEFGGKSESTTRIEEGEIPHPKGNVATWIRSILFLVWLVLPLGIYHNCTSRTHL
jgi:hypothetical protein